MYHSKNQWEEETLECDDVSKNVWHILLNGGIPSFYKPKHDYFLDYYDVISPKMHFFQI